MAAPLCVRRFAATKLKVLCSLRTFCIDTVLHSNAGNEAKTQKTHFGYETVDEDEKEEKVYHVFHNVAEKYDTMNDAMSFGIHRLWKDQFIERLGPSAGTQLLDVAGGTGDIAFRFLNYVHNEDCNNSNNNSERSESEEIQEQTQTHVTVCDINQAMLDVGKKRAENMGISAGISWLRGNAENLPVSHDAYDAYTIAFGIRNCTHVDKVLTEAYRVLKPGGRFMCLEFSEVPNPVLRKFYDEYSFQVIPVMGQVIAGDWKSYQYLVESIRQFPQQDVFADMIREAGFRAVSYENLTMGIAAIHSGFKL